MVSDNKSKLQSTLSQKSIYSKGKWEKVEIEVKIYCRSENKMHERKSKFNS